MHILTDELSSRSVDRCLRRSKTCKPRILEILEFESKILHSLFIALIGRSVDHILGIKSGRIHRSNPLLQLVLSLRGVGIEEIAGYMIRIEVLPENSIISVPHQHFNDLP